MHGYQVLSINKPIHYTDRHGLTLRHVPPTPTSPKIKSNPVSLPSQAYLKGQPGLSSFCFFNPGQISRVAIFVRIHLLYAMHIGCYWDVCLTARANEYELLACAFSCSLNEKSGAPVAVDGVHVHVKFVKAANRGAH